MSSSLQVSSELPVAALAGGGPVLKKFSTIEKRIQSFDSSFRDIYPPFVTMAKAGFFQTGIDDTVMCYYCGLCISFWSPHDSP